MNHETWTCGSSIELPQMLDARERRANIQQEMLSQTPASLLSFTLNIAGPVKVFPFTKWLYFTGLTIVTRGISYLDGKILAQREIHEDTGYECFFALSLAPEEIKAYLMEQEEHHPLGRLFDFDVLRPDGTKVSRQELGFPERTCLICNSPAFLCGRSRTHTARELITREIQMMEDFYLSRMSVHIGLLMQKSLFYEVNTTLKPGLVDRKHNGSHKDMCIDTFVTSAYALAPYFIQCAKAGLSFSQNPEQLPELFRTLRKLGKDAENTMLTATGGINTHKGIIFSGGILCAAAGYAKSQFRTDFHSLELSEQLSCICQRMLPHLLDDYRNLNDETAVTHGEKLYAAYQITGIRGEASKGFPHLFFGGLPAFCQALENGCSLNDAGLVALLYYIAHTEDTNLIIRSDYDTAAQIQTKLADFLQTADVQQQLAVLCHLDKYFVSKNISPGGSADMLALTYFMHFLQHTDCCFD